HTGGQPDTRANAGAGPPATSGTSAGQTKEARRLGRPADSRSTNASWHDVIGRDELHAFAGLDHLPLALVDESVVVVAEREEVAQGAGPASGTKFDVMRAGPADRPVATGKPAGPVPGLEGSPLRRRDIRSGSADIHHPWLSMEVRRHDRLGRGRRGVRGVERRSRASCNTSAEGQSTHAVVTVDYINISEY